MGKKWRMRHMRALETERGREGMAFIVTRAMSGLIYIKSLLSLSALAFSFIYSCTALFLLHAKSKPQSRSEWADPGVLNMALVLQSPLLLSFWGRSEVHLKRYKPCKTQNDERNMDSCRFNSVMNQSRCSFLTSHVLSPHSPPSE